MIENLWGGRQARKICNFRPPPPPRRETPAVSAAEQDGARSNGEFWWKQALERHTGIAGAISRTILWETLFDSLAIYFLEVLGQEGHDRPFQVGAALSSAVCHGCPLSRTGLKFDASRRAVGILMKPMRDKTKARMIPGGKKDDSCDDGFCAEVR